MTISDTTPSRETLVADSLRRIDYRDAFRVASAQNQFGSVEEFATAYFLGQPRWLSLLSLGTPSRDTLEREIDDGSYRPGSSIGSWKVRDRGANEIIFGDEMGFMEYRFSMFRDPVSGTIEVSTVVEFLWRRTGRFYFAAVKPLHRRFARSSLRAALRRAEMENPVGARERD